MKNDSMFQQGIAESLLVEFKIDMDGLFQEMQLIKHAGD
jgi:hypothetical protein